MMSRESLSAPLEWTPEVQELSPGLAPVDVFLALCDLPHCIFLDSAVLDPHRGRYSYVAADPFEVIRDEGTAVDPLGLLQDRLGNWSSRRVEELPPFQGGAAGVLSYDLAGTLERLPTPRCQDFDLPRLLMGLYDVVVAFDHRRQQAWVISQGWPEVDLEQRRKRAASRLERICQRIKSPSVRPTWQNADGLAGTNDVDFQAKQEPARHALHYPVPGPTGLMSNFSVEGYIHAVQQAIEHIYAGDIFQVNLSQRLICPARLDSISLYLKLRDCNPAPFAGYFDLGRYQILSASPERFLHVLDGVVETRPIKGTRRRSAGVEADLFVGDDLRQSEKDRAENVMIVDLMRNDLSRVCRPESVQVTQLCEVEAYQFVQHLVSAVVGELQPGKTVVDLLRATFPGGSITGAPKIRAMEIIAELEPHARGAYCGSLGYLGWDGTVDLSILIRTITAGQGWWQLPVGGGIVAGSDPQREYEETWHKAEGLLRSL